jgi:cobalt/nickel transport system permease protein
MHIPDGFVTAPVAGAGIAISAGCIAYAVSATNKKLSDKQIPLMGVLAAFIFVAQMLNFPIAGGTSGHILGAALAAILIGPWAGMLVMTCVMVVQSLIFQDGGLLALGVNVFNMGVIGCLASFYIYKGILLPFKSGRTGILLAGGIAAWCSVIVASVMAALELAISGLVPYAVALPAMAGVHVLIGIGEGLITAAVLGLVLSTRADLLQLQKA